jgi:magnesium chelatase subunit D
MAAITLDNSFIRALACAALQPGLRSILIFNAPDRQLPLVAGLLQQMLQQTGGIPVKQYSLGPTEQEDDLWGSLLWPDGENATRLRKKPRIFSKQANQQTLQLISIPDLTRPGLPVLRACVTLVGSEVASVQRHGQNEIWHPNYCWLAACEQAKIGQISPHLLDRFVLRLWWQDFPSRSDANDRAASIAHWLDTPLSALPQTLPLPEEIKRQLRQAVQQRVQITDEALQSIVSYTSLEAAIFPRREIALARLALAHAQLALAPELLPEHVEEAISLLKRTEPASPSPTTDEPEPEAGQPDEELPVTNTFEPASVAAPSPQQFPSRREEEVYAGMPAEELEDSPLPLEDSYPEDRASHERELTPLHLPQINIPTARAHKGVIIGVEPTDTLEDLALTATLFAAAPYQKIRAEYLRRKEQNEQEEQKEKVGFLLMAADLRKYRHAPIAQSMLTLLLDYTCVRAAPEQVWIDALMPYLHAAYVRRASVCLVQVGVADPQAKVSLRAIKILARNMLAGSVSRALADLHGNATPLPHGLRLALETMRQALQHGRSTVQQVTFVALTDGRANVPLSASLNGIIVASDQAIGESLEQARAINELNNVEKVLICPSLSYYRELPINLANALGATFRTFAPGERRGDERYE